MNYSSCSYNILRSIDMKNIGCSVKMGKMTIDDVAVRLCSTIISGSSNGLINNLGDSEHISTSDKLSIFRYACSKDNINIVNILANHGFISDEPRDLRDLLLDLVRASNTILVENMLSRYEVNVSPYIEEATILASGLGYGKVLQILLNPIGQVGLSALRRSMYAAASSGHVNIMKILVDHDSCITDNEMTSVLEVALAHRHYDAVEFLMDAGVTEGADDQYLIYQMQTRTVDDVVNALSAGKFRDIDIIDALVYAAVTGMVDMLSILVDYQPWVTQAARDILIQYPALSAEVNALVYDQDTLK